MRFCGLCFNWKVVAGLAVVGLGVWALAPGVFAAAGPVLLVLACPLSMLFMMRGMNRAQDAHGDASTTSGGRRRPADAAHVANGTVPVPPAVVLSREEQLAELRAELERVRRRHEALAGEIDVLDSAPAVREAEAVARAAERRSGAAR